jgi:hypothetical protein
VETIASAGDRPSVVRQQGRNTAESVLYGTWVSSTNDTVIIDADKITYRNTNGDFIVIVSCTWTSENNSDIKTLVDYPKGFKLSGIVTENKGQYGNLRYTPIYLFIHKNDPKKMYFYRTPNTESIMQDTNFGPLGKIQ